jgi:hypothetical protein
MRWTGHVARSGKDECIYEIGREARKKEITRKTNI